MLAQMEDPDNEEEKEEKDEKAEDEEDNENQEENEEEKQEDDAPKRDMGQAFRSNMNKMVKSTVKRGGKNRGILAQLQLLDSIVSVSNDFFSTEANSMSVPKNYMNFVNPYEIKQDIEPQLQINYQE